MWREGAAREAAFESKDRVGGREGGREGKEGRERGVGAGEAGVQMVWRM